jgi:hypothetical protein
MTNGHRFLVRIFYRLTFILSLYYQSDELGKKAEQILGHATAILDCRRQTSMDFHGQPPRLNIT